MDVNRTGIPFVIKFPDEAQQLFTRQSKVSVVYQHLKQIKFTGFERYLLTVFIDLAAVEFDADVIELEKVRITFRSAKYRFYSFDEFKNVKRLRYIVVCTEAQAFYSVVL